MENRLPKAIIVDVDGTLALRGDRDPYDFCSVLEDTENLAVCKLVRMLGGSCGSPYQILVFSGRPESCAIETEKWLLENLIPFSKLLMRKPGDDRKDSTVKKELFDLYVKDKFDVEFVLDDRDQVVKMWREELNLPCFQVAYGNF